VNCAAVWPTFVLAVSYQTLMWPPT